MDKLKIMKELIDANEEDLDKLMKIWDIITNNTRVIAEPIEQRRTGRRVSVGKYGRLATLTTDKSRKVTQKIFEYLEENKTASLSDISKAIPELGGRKADASFYARTVLAKFPHIRRRVENREHIYYYQK
jgi:hypothetical protein